MPPRHRRVLVTSTIDRRAFLGIVFLLLAGCGPLATPTTGPLSPTASPASAAGSPSGLEGAALGGGCPVTPFETIPANGVVAWDQSIWQRATDGIWAHPYLDSYGPGGASSASDANLKILWWVLAAGEAPVDLTVTATTEGSYSDHESFDPPGRNRRDRPTEIRTPPPGCYSIAVTVGTRHGTIVERVVP